MGSLSLCALDKFFPVLYHILTFILYRDLRTNFSQSQGSFCCCYYKIQEQNTCFLKYPWEVSVPPEEGWKPFFEGIVCQCQVLDYIYSSKACLLSSFVLLLNPLILYHFLLQCTQHLDTFSLGFSLIIHIRLIPQLDLKCGHLFIPCPLALNPEYCFPLLLWNLLIFSSLHTFSPELKRGHKQKSATRTYTWEFPQCRRKVVVYLPATRTQVTSSITGGPESHWSFSTGLGLAQ